MSCRVMDYTASAVAIIIAVGVMGGWLLGRPIPAEIAGPFGGVIAYLFVRGTQAASDSRRDAS